MYNDSPEFRAMINRTEPSVLQWQKEKQYVPPEEKPSYWLEPKTDFWWATCQYDWYRIRNQPHDTRFCVEYALSMRFRHNLPGQFQSLEEATQSCQIHWERLQKICQLPITSWDEVSCCDEQYEWVSQPDKQWRIGCNSDGLFEVRLHWGPVVELTTMPEPFETIREAKAFCENWKPEQKDEPCPATQQTTVACDQ